MIKNYFVFTKEMGQLLIKCRKQARLSQGEVAKRCGLHSKTGYSQISRFESGRIKNPSLGSIILYLKACNTPLVSFFQELSTIDFKIEHEKIMRQVDPAPMPIESQDEIPKLISSRNVGEHRGGVEMPSGLTPLLRQKVDRDTAKYVNKIQYPKTPFQKLDWERVKTKIDKKVKVLLCNHELKENMKTPYFQFTNQLIDNYDTGQLLEIFKKYWQAGSLNRFIISEIRSIVYKTVRVEQRRLEKPKPLAREKLQKMASKFLKHRVRIEPIDPAPFYKMSGDKTISFECDITQPDKRGGVEAEVQRKLGELNVPIVQNQAYKDFTRECYSAFKKYYRKDPLLLTQRFTEIIKSWKAQGLNEEILEIVKETTIRIFTQQK